MIETLNSELCLKTEIKPVVIETVTEATKVELNELREKVKDLQSSIKVRDGMIKDLEHANKMAKEVSDAVHKKLKETKINVNKKKAEITKKHRAEVKTWKKELGEANKENIKLKKKVDKLENKDLPKPKPSSPTALPDRQDSQDSRKAQKSELQIF